MSGKGFLGRRQKGGENMHACMHCLCGLLLLYALFDRHADRLPVCIFSILGRDPPAGE